MRVCLKKEKTIIKLIVQVGKMTFLKLFVVHKQSVKKTTKIGRLEQNNLLFVFSKLTHHSFFFPLLMCCSLSDDFNVNNMRKTMKTVMNRLLRSKMSKRKLFDNDFVCWRKKVCVRQRNGAKI